MLSYCYYYIIIVIVHRRLIHAVSFLVAQYPPEINPVNNLPWLNLILFPSRWKLLHRGYLPNDHFGGVWSMTTTKYKVYQP